MHSYLRAIGFSNIKNRADLQKIIGIVMDQPTEKYSKKINDTSTIVELKKDFAMGIGIGIIGEYDEKGFFHLGHYFPYFRNKYISLKEEIFINKRVDTDAYTGMCDDIRFGISLIFYLQNCIDLIEEKPQEWKSRRKCAISLSGLSVQGKIILGIQSQKSGKKNGNKEHEQRKRLIAEAKQGNQEAIDSLTLEDIDLYAMVSRRIRYQDIYTIVENSLVPYGSESDTYSVVGTIIEWKSVVNPFTNEEIYELLLDCNDLILGVCINKRDLIGMPMKNSRFKGIIWLQGNLQ